MTKQYGDFQNEIYVDGLSGKLPKYPVDFAGIEEKAQAVLPWWVLSYVAGGCGDETTQRANMAAFQRYGTTPRMMVGATTRDLSVDLWGIKLPSPLFMSPIGVIGICSQDFHGDVQVAQASSITGVPMVASTLTQDPMEQVRPLCGDTPSIYQLYTPNNRDLALSFIERAENSGYQAIAVTADTWVTGWRPRDINYANFPQLRGYCLANYATDEHFRKLLAKPWEQNPEAAVLQWMNTWTYPLTWDDLKWIREATKLPLVVKGICHPDDAKRSLDLGADGIYCSNHGGRQANGGKPALYCLPEVVKVAQGKPVLFDSGVRSGTDAAKALALGATAVGIGRPYAYSLAIGGVPALVQMLHSFLAELDLFMAIDGYRDLEALTHCGIEFLP